MVRTGISRQNTANGETYDQHDRTAAHRTLQMPSVLRVTNLENGQSTVVRVNDRGPFARSRILDVSQVAAEELGMTSATAPPGCGSTSSRRKAGGQADRDQRRRPRRAARGHRERPPGGTRCHGDRPIDTAAPTTNAKTGTGCFSASTPGIGARAHARRDGLSKQPANRDGLAARAPTWLGRQDWGRRCAKRRLDRDRGSIVCERCAGRWILRSDRRFLDGRQCREAARHDHQLRHIRDFPRVLGWP